MFAVYGLPCVEDDDTCSECTPTLTLYYKTLYSIGSVLLTYTNNTTQSPKKNCTHGKYKNHLTTKSLSLVHCSYLNHFIIYLHACVLLRDHI